MKSKSKIFIIDDHAVFREGLSLLIEQTEDLEVCGEASELHGTITLIKETSPDIIILDISLKESSGIELLKDLKKSKIKTPVLILSMHNEIYYADRVLREGAKGYIMKQEPSEKLLDAVYLILEGQIYLSKKITNNVLTMQYNKKKQSDASPIDQLTNRELEVLDLIGHGLSTHQIARQLNLNVKTVGTYREKIKLKLNLNSGVELTKFAIHWVGNE